MSLLLWSLFILSCVASTQTVCPSEPVNVYAEQGANYLTSPNYPNSYGVNGERLSCSWQIWASPGFDDVIIQMQVINSSMEPATGCGRDSVEIIDGSRKFHPSLVTWCGRTWPSEPIVSTGPAALVTFSTNFKDNDYYGFMLAYWVAKEPQLQVNISKWNVLNYVLMGISVVLFSGTAGFFSIIFLTYLLKRCQMTEDEIYAKKYL